MLNWHGMDMSDEELEALYEKEIEPQEPKRETWNWLQIAVLAFDLLAWWFIVCCAIKLWPR